MDGSKSNSMSGAQKRKLKRQREEKLNTQPKLDFFVSKSKDTDIASAEIVPIETDRAICLKDS